MADYIERKIELSNSKILRIRGCYLGGPGVITIRAVDKNEKNFNGDFKIYLDLETAITIANAIIDISDIVKISKRSKQ